MGVERRIALESDGLPAHEVLTDKLGDRAPIRSEQPQNETSDFLEWLKTIEPWDEEFPDVDEGLLPMEDVEL